MDSLKQLLESLNFTHVSTYLQSGNIVFKSDVSDEIVLCGLIETAIEEKLELKVPVIIRSASLLKSISENNPFLLEQDIDITKLHVTFLSKDYDHEGIGKINKIAFTPDRYILQGNEVFIYCPGGYGNTKLNNSLFENKLKVISTTRNWNTINALVRLSEM